MGGCSTFTFFFLGGGACTYRACECDSYACVFSCKLFQDETRNLSLCTYTTSHPFKYRQNNSSRNIITNYELTRPHTRTHSLTGRTTASCTQSSPSSSSCAVGRSGYRRYRPHRSSTAQSSHHRASQHRPTTAKVSRSTTTSTGHRYQGGRGPTATSSTRSTASAC